MTTAFQVMDQFTSDVESAAAGMNCAALRMKESTWEESAALLARLRQARKRLQEVENGFERYIAEVWTDQHIRDPQEVPGVGLVKVRKTADRKSWQHEEITKVLLETWIAEHGGEIPDAWTTRDLLLDVGRFDYWRVRKLRALKINPDDYCEVIPGRSTVDIEAVS